MTRQMKSMLLSPLFVLAGCAAAPADTCDLESPPESSLIRTTLGVDVATFPAVVPHGYTGCQRMWVGDQREPRRMQPLSTLHYEAGRVVRLAGQEPGGPAYDCRYSSGALDVPGSLNAGRCPLASELDGGMK